MNTRRDFIKTATAGIGAISLPGMLQAGVAGPIFRKKIVCVGGHPDDPESGCGGTLAKLAAMGHEVTIIYLTTGEAGINGVGHDEAARIRKQEAINACRILNCKPVFAGQIDGDTVVSNETLQHLQGLIGQENPDMVFCHWPIESIRTINVPVCSPYKPGCGRRISSCCIFLKFAPASRQWDFIQPIS
jgi:hypothetical protein